MKILLSDIVKSDVLAFHEEGLNVFPLLENALKKSTRLEISFEGIKMCSTQFLHSSIGKLYLMYPESKIEELITFDFASIPLLKEKMEKVIWSSINSSVYNKIISEATSIN